MDNWRKVIYSDEFRIFIGQGNDTETFVMSCSNEIYKNNCWNKSSKSAKSKERKKERKKERREWL